MGTFKPSLWNQGLGFALVSSERVKVLVIQAVPNSQTNDVPQVCSQLDLKSSECIFPEQLRHALQVGFLNSHWKPIESILGWTMVPTFLQKRTSPVVVFLEQHARVPGTFLSYFKTSSRGCGTAASGPQWCSLPTAR